MKKVLIVSYVFPPIAYAGTYRTLRFTRYLPDNGYLPYVLTIKEAADLHNDHSLLERLPECVKVYRTMTLDFWRTYQNRIAKRRLKKQEKFNHHCNAAQIHSPSRKNNLKKYINELLADMVTTPDHMVFWIPFAIAKGIQVVRNQKCDLIYTTSPPHSEHLIGLILSKVFKIPWVADFRDPILDSSGYAPSKLRLRIDTALERAVVNNSRKIIVISDHYKRLICQRYPGLTGKFVVIPNGFDPEIFENAPTERFDKFTILYSGSFYANRRPRFFLRALSKWFAKQPPEIGEKVRVLFYGPKSDEAARIIVNERLESVVNFGGMIPQDTLIPKQKGTNLLLLIIGFDAESKGTITSKVFEYMACQKPILAIVPEGDCADILRSAGYEYIVSRNDPQHIINILAKEFNHYQKNNGINAQKINKYRIEPFNAVHQTRKLSQIFNTLLK